MILVILSRRSAAKDLKLRILRPFASLRVTRDVLRSATRSAGILPAVAPASCRQLSRLEAGVTVVELVMR
jgi:hypothetical protein